MDANIQTESKGSISKLIITLSYGLGGVYLLGIATYLFLNLSIDFTLGVTILFLATSASYAIYISKSSLNFKDHCSAIAKFFRAITNLQNIKNFLNVIFILGAVALGLLLIVGLFCGISSLRFAWIPFPIYMAMVRYCR